MTIHRCTLPQNALLHYLNVTFISHKITFTALMLLVGLQEGNLARENFCFKTLGMAVDISGRGKYPCELTMWVPYNRFDCLWGCSE